MLSTEFKKLIPYFKPYRFKVVGAFICLSFAAFAVLALGGGLKHVIGEGFSKQNPDLLNQALLGLLSITFLLALASYGRYYLVSWLGERVVATLRQDIYNHLLTLSPSYFEKTKVGDILSSLTADTTVLQMVIGSSLSSALRNFLMLIGGTVLLMITSPKLTAFVFLVVPLVVVPIIFFGRRVKGLSKKSQEKIGLVSAACDETLHGIRIVQAFGQEAHEIEQFNQATQDAFVAAIDRIKIRAFLTALVIFLVFSAISFILWTGGHDVLSDKMSAGDLAAFLFYAVVVAGAVGALSEVSSDFKRASGAISRLFDLLKIETDIASPEHPLPLPQPALGGINFEMVTFHYPSRPKTAALHNFTLNIEPGEVVAFVGPSGAGKSTLFQLLLRFYDPTQGTIKLDGIPLQKANLQDARRLMAIVPQDPVIFSTNVFENIRYGKRDATDAEVIEAARMAYADDFITKLPEGYQTYLGEKGVRLSGGQKQRIAIARAILRNPTILLLDEATSALDTQSERYVQQALTALMKGRTTLVIAHRLSTIQKADRIIVMKDGEISQMGTHESLLKDDGIYARLSV